jgi:hypothetical protein
MNMDHDQNFKNLILDYPRQALAFFAADEARTLPTDARILPVRQEQLKKRLGDRFRELDVPLLVEWPDGRREALLFVIEEETNPKYFSIHRLAHYCLDLAEMFDTTRIVPVVIFLRAGQPQFSLELGGERHRYLSFHYLSCELAKLPFEQHKLSDNIVTRLNLPNMNFPPECKVDVYAYAVRGLMELESNMEKRLKYLDFIDIYSDLDDEQRQRYEREYPEEADTMSSFADRFIQKGLQQGMQQGEARLLLRLLHNKFGTVPEETSRRIEAADAETLLQWSDRVLTASRIDDVLH